MEGKKLDKVLNRLDVLVLAFGAMIGWGWVVLSGTWISSAGSIGAMLAFVIGGIMVIFVGLTYAELASAMPKVGGELTYVLRGIGPKASFIASWAIALGYISVVAFEAVALPTVVEYLFPNYTIGYMWTIAGWDVYFTWVLVGMVGSIFVTIINYLGLKPAAIIQMVLTIIIAIVGLMLIFGASVGGDTSNFHPLFAGGMAGLMAVIIMTPFMFVGFDVIPQAAEEMNIPPRSIGKILIISVILAVIWYIAIIYGVSMALDKEGLANSSLASADAMGAAFGSDFFAKILILGGIAGILTSWNAFIIGGSRIIYAMAQSGMLPAWWGYLHPKYKTPSNAILVIGVLATLCPLLGRPMLVWLVDAGGLAIVIAYFLVALSFLALRKNEPQMERPFRAGKEPIIGWIALILSLGFIILYMPGMPAALVWPYEWLIILVWWVIGIYYLITRRNYYESNSE